MNPEVARIVELMNRSEYLKTLKDKEVLAEKLIKVYCIDIGNEIKKIDLWLYANPNKRYKNYKRFIVNWLSRKDRPYGK
jgi:hypothetical protein